MPTRCGSSPLTRGKHRHRSRGNPHQRLIPAHAGKTFCARHSCRWKTAHPRSRGENALTQQPAFLKDGSSPLTRGKPRGGGLEVRDDRLIPAHAGKTFSSWARLARSSAHPRSRGENVIDETARESLGGSSPLTRGKPAQVDYPSDRTGLIPAHAGKTVLRPLGAGACAAHPRSRGENNGQSTHHRVSAGSSPLTRGKQASDGHHGIARRLIPAHAGKTLRGRFRPARMSAHPRSRGENRDGVLKSMSIGGSSPLTRGKHLLTLHTQSLERLIPAHAGKTCRREPSPLPMTAHPRSRGENRRLLPTQLSCRGSSPLTRGKPSAATTPIPALRLIPAHAGKTTYEGSVTFPRAAHPRSRGENPLGTMRAFRLRGSSPLTRGKPRDMSVYYYTAGLIPAHAGKTECCTISSQFSRAHPRSRGENAKDPDWMPLRHGSSPLTRGKPCAQSYPGPPGRLIPAHAGKTNRPALRGRSLGAHPRSRGENQRAHLSEVGGAGSSPLTRGKHFPTCAFTAQIDQILETLELAVSSGSYSVWVACATDAPQDQVRSIGLVLPSSRGAS